VPRAGCPIVTFARHAVCMSLHTVHGLAFSRASLVEHPPQRDARFGVQGGESERPAGSTSAPARPRRDPARRRRACRRGPRGRRARGPAATSRRGGTPRACGLHPRTAPRWPRRPRWCSREWRVDCLRPRRGRTSRRPSRARREPRRRARRTGRASHSGGHRRPAAGGLRKEIVRGATISRSRNRTLTSYPVRGAGAPPSAVIRASVSSRGDASSSATTHQAPERSAGDLGLPLNRAASHFPAERHVLASRASLRNIASLRRLQTRHFAPRRRSGNRGARFRSKICLAQSRGALCPRERRAGHLGDALCPGKCREDFPERRYRAHRRFRECGWRSAISRGAFYGAGRLHGAKRRLRNGSVEPIESNAR
jgi:hypothetical protein